MWPKKIPLKVPMYKEKYGRYFFVSQQKRKLQYLHQNKLMRKQVESAQRLPVETSVIVGFN